MHVHIVLISDFNIKYILFYKLLFTNTIEYIYRQNVFIYALFLQLTLPVDNLISLVYRLPDSINNKTFTRLSSLFLFIKIQ